MSITFNFCSINVLVYLEHKIYLLSYTRQTKISEDLVANTINIKCKLRTHAI